MAIDQVWRLLANYWHAEVTRSRHYFPLADDPNNRKEAQTSWKIRPFQMTQLLSRAKTLIISRALIPEAT